MRISCCSFIVLICSAFSVYGQTIRGTVIDSLTRQPVAFANITLEDGRTGATAEIEGKFSLSVPASYTGAIYLSHVTYQRRIVPLTYFNNHTTIALLPSTNVLQE